MIVYSYLQACIDLPATQLKIRSNKYMTASLWKSISVRSIEAEQLVCTRQYSSSHVTRSVELAEQEAVLKERDLAVQSQAGFGFGGCFVSVINWGQGTLGDTWNMAWMFGSVSDFLGKVLVVLAAKFSTYFTPNHSLRRKNLKASRSCCLERWQM